MLYIFNLNEQLQAVLNNDGTACPYSDPIHDEKLTGENTFTFTVPANHADSQYITEGNLVAFKDLDLNWQLFEIKRIIDLHGNGLTKTVFCEHAAYELHDDFIEDVRPTDCSATFALTQALSGTRWSVGTVDDLGLNSTNYYYESALSAVQKVASVWAGELRFRVVVTGGVISNRYVDLLVRRGADTGKQFEYGRHTEEIEREIDLTTVATALYGRGKGVEVGEGYGRRLDFGSIVWTTPTNPVNKPLDQEWVGDPDALTQWGHSGGRHRFGVFEDPEETDAAILLQKTWDALQERKTPRATYRMTVMDLERLSGYSHEKVRLGDTVRAIDRKFSPTLLVAARVIELSRNLLQPKDTKITLGNFAPSLADDALLQQEVVKTVRDRQGVWDSATPFVGPVPTSWLNGIIDILQNEIQNTSAYVWVTETDGILIQNAATFADATKAMKIGGGTFALANTKNGSQWNWRTFGDGAGFTADEMNAGKIRTNLVKIEGNTNFYWDGDYLYIVNPSNLNEQIRLSKEGIRFTKDGGTTWNVALAFDGLRMEGKPSDPRIWYAPDGERIYNQNGELVGHLGYYETLADQTATFARASTAYLSDGSSVASGVPRYEYMRQSAPVWQDLFDANSLDKYTSGGNTAATWAISGGVLTATGGNEAILVKNDLLLQGCEIEITTDQAARGIALARYQDANNYYYLALYDNTEGGGTGVIGINKRVASVGSGIVSTSINFPRGTAKTVKFTLHGSLLEAWFDGAKVLSVTDTTFTGGGVGLRQHAPSPGTSTRFLDFAVYVVEHGIMVEEGTTNLLTANQASVETDLTGFSSGGSSGTVTLTRDTVEKYHGTASAKLVSNYAGTHTAWTYVTAQVPVTPGQQYTWSAYLKAQAAYGRQIQVVIRWFDSVGGIISDSLATHTVTPAWGRYSVAATAPANAAKCDVFVYFMNCLQNEVLWYDCGQVEQKAYATTWQLPGTARAVETLTAPTANVLNVSEGEISLDVIIDPNGVHSANNPNWNIAFAVATVQQSPYQEQNQISIRRNFSAASWDVYFSNASGGTAEVPLGNITTPGVYRITASWKSGVGGYAYLNGVLKGSVPAANLPTAFNSTMVIGAWTSAGDLPVSSPIKDFRVLNRMRTDSEVLADYNTGLPLTVDDATTYLMSMDGHLKPTVRRFGLWSKNGEITLENPPVNGGIRVYDALNNLRCHIGQYASGKYGAKIINGEIYSSTIRTGPEGATSYTELGSGGNDPLRVVVNGKAALSIWALSGSGMLQFFDTNLNDMMGQILPYNDAIGQGLRIQGRNNAGISMPVHMQGSFVRIDSDSDIILAPGASPYDVTVSGNLFVTGTMSAGGDKPARQKTESYGERHLYARESPDVRYIIENKAQLINGECRIDLDPIFLECVEPNTDSTLWTFGLTPFLEPTEDLYIAEVRETFFVVKEPTGLSNGQFFWKLSAIRKGFAGKWLEEHDAGEDVLTSGWEDKIEGVV